MGRQPLPTNTIIGNGGDQYRIDTVLGPGGFGVTYLARDVRFDRDVAIKEYFPAEFAYREGSTTIRSSTRGSKQDFFEQGKRYFLDEARILGKFRHEHIVRVLNLFEQYNTAYMVLEFEEGQSLKHWLRDLGRRPTQEELDAIVRPMLDALEVIHSKGLFHRDIAPDNIIVRPTGKPVLIDFGAARNFVRENSFTIGAIVKHGYSPPEQYTLDTKLQGAWSDIYSLCATIYFAMMGEPPEEASKRQLGDSMLPIEDNIDAYHRGLYSPSMIAALNEGLKLRPRERPATIAELRALMYPDAAAVQPISIGRPAVRNGTTSAELPRSGPQSDPQVGPGGVPRDGSVVGHSDEQATRVGGLTGVEAVAAQALRGSTTGVSSTGVRHEGTVVGRSGRPEAAQEAAPAEPASIGSSYPEQSMRIAGIVALAVATASALGFLMVGGIEHPGGLAAAMLLCAGLVAVGLERACSLAWVEHNGVGPAATAGAVMSALALAVYWLPLFLWPLSLLLGGLAVFFAFGRFGRWVPTAMVVVAVIHFAIALLMLFLATRSIQKDPLFLPMMGISLALVAGLVTACAVQIQKRWEPAV